MKAPLGPPLREVVSFALIGVLNTALSLTVIWLVAQAGGGPYLANVCGYALGLANSFAMNRAFTFRDAPQSAGAAWRFIATFGMSYAVNLGVLTLGLAIEPSHAFLWQALAMIAYTGTFFTLSKRFVFR